MLFFFFLFLSILFNLKEYKRIQFINTLYSIIFMVFNSKINKKIAIVDSSFWININRVGLVDYLLERFELIFTSKVEDELLVNFKLFYTPRDIIVYNKLKDMDLIKIRNPKNVSDNLYNSLCKTSGEVQTIALAIELNGAVLVDNSAAIEYCIKNKIQVINTINFILYSYDQDKLTYEQSLEKINILKPFIRDKYIYQNLDLLAQIKGDKYGIKKDK